MKFHKRNFVIKLPFSQAKRLGFYIKGYVFTKEKSTPQPVIEKSNYKSRKKKEKKETIPLKQYGNVFKLDLE